MARLMTNPFARGRRGVPRARARRGLAGRLAAHVLDFILWLWRGSPRDSVSRLKRWKRLRRLQRVSGRPADQAGRAGRAGRNGRGGGALAGWLTAVWGSASATSQSKDTGRAQAAFGRGAFLRSSGPGAQADPIARQGGLPVTDLPQPPGARARSNASVGGAQLFLGLFASLALLALSWLGHDSVTNLRSAIVMTARPMTDAVSRPVMWLRTRQQTFATAMTASARLERLEQTALANEQWKWRAQQLERELKSLRRQLNLVEDAAVGFVTGRVITDASSPFQETLLLNVGARQDVRVGQAVVDAAGLIGRTVEVAPNATRVLLLSDPAARVPVLVGAAGRRAILVGRGRGAAELHFLADGPAVALGNAVTTSGHGGVFPPGVPVGRVADIASVGAAGAGLHPTVNLLAAPKRAVFASVLLFDGVRLPATTGTRSSRSLMRPQALAATNVDRQQQRRAAVRHTAMRAGGLP